MFVEGLISVIIPIYNSEEHIEECIESVLNQSYKNFELILVDDGSQDNSLDICKKYQKKDDRIIVHSKVNTGVSDTRNLGLALSKGEYVSFIDSDDYIVEKMLAVMIENINKQGVDLVVTNYKLDYSHKKIEKKPRLETRIFSVDELEHKLIDDGTMTGILFGSVCFCLYKKEIIVRGDVNFNKNVKVNEDGLFNILYLKYSDNINYLGDMHLYVYRQHESLTSYNCDDIVSRFKAVNNEIEIILEKDNLVIERQILARKISVSLWNILSICNKRNSDPLRKKLSCIKRICSDESTADGFKHINRNDLNIYKKTYYYLMKMKMSISLYVLTKYVYPVLEKVLAR